MWEEGNDVSSMISYGPLFISPNDTLKVAFVLSAGKNLFELQNAALQANKLYHGETGIFQESKSNFKLYPNPSKEYIYVDGLQNGERYKISIFDNLGRMVYSAKTFNENRAKIDVSTLKNGIWFLKIETNSSVEVQTFIKE
ncbi:MAG: T9SS type A sorting domain-containing protein [Bacteroidales bacterium]